MKIYKVERTDGYDALVVVAESPEDATNMICDAYDNDWGRPLGKNFLENVEAKEVELVRGVVLGSFNAG